MGVSNNKKNAGLSRRLVITGLSSGVLGHVLTRAMLEAWPATPSSQHVLIQTIEDITDRIIAERVKGDPAKPLFVLMGEHHNKPSHKIVMQGVIERLREKNYSLAVGMEIPRGVLIDVMKDESALRQAWLGTPLCKADLNSGEVLYRSGDQSVKNFLKYLAAEGIPTQNNDLNVYACSLVKEKRVLYWEDKANLAYLAAAGIEPSENIYPSQRTGIRLRNMGLSDAAIEHAHDVRASIYIQHTGAYHLVGDDGEQFPIEESLMLELKKKGQSVLAFDLSGQTRVHAANALIESGQLVLIKGLPDKKFDHEGNSLEDLLAYSASEQQYIAALARSANVKLYQGPPPSVEALMLLRQQRQSSKTDGVSSPSP